MTLALVAACLAPLAVFGVVLLLAGVESQWRSLLPALVAALVGAALFGLLLAMFTVGRLTDPLRRITFAVERVAAGEPGPPLPLSGDDEIGRLAESHNRIASEVSRRNQALARLLAAVAGYAPESGTEKLVAQAGQDARVIFGLIECSIRLVPPRQVPTEERIPGDPRPVRAELRAGADALGVLTGHLPATRSWDRADQDLLDLFASEVGVALRNAELFGQIERQNARLRELDAAKDEFLRGVSHNLQTPLTSIRAYVDQLRAGTPSGARAGANAGAGAGAGADAGATADAAGLAVSAPDRRLDIVAEQTDRLTRLVRQLLTVTRLEAGVLKAQPEVMALAPRIRRTWEALNAPDVEFELRDEASDWLAVADPDQLDQILWALLDNAVKYGGRQGKVDVRIRPAADGPLLEVTIADGGPGVSREDRERLFTRFTRGATQASGEGTGLGLYVSRQLARAMEGDLWLEPAEPGSGAAFTIALPGERVDVE